MSKQSLRGSSAGVRAREAELLARLAALPLASRPPPMGQAAIDRLAEAVRVYPVRIYRAVSERAERYDAVWGLRGESEIATFLDFQCVRRLRSLRTFVPSNHNRLPAWREVIQTQGVQP